MRGINSGVLIHTWRWDFYKVCVWKSYWKLFQFSSLRHTVGSYYLILFGVQLSWLMRCKLRCTVCDSPCSPPSKLRSGRSTHQPGFLSQLYDKQCSLTCTRCIGWVRGKKFPCIKPPRFYGWSLLQYRLWCRWKKRQEEPCNSHSGHCYFSWTSQKNKILILFLIPNYIQPHGSS